RLRIRRSNFRLPSDIQSKEATLQVVYDVLRNSPLFRAFQVTTDVPEIYMQEFWATAKLHHNSIRFKIDTRKSVLDLEAFREMLHISPKVPNQPFANLPTEEEVLDFLRFLGHSQDIRYLTDVVSRHQAIQQYGAILPIELTTAEIRNSKAYQEYHACAMGEAAPKPKASARKKKDDDDDDEEEETAKDDEEDKETGNGGDEVRESGGESEEEEETSEEEEGSFDPIPRTPEDS
nr:hypothetical protein [Tanacetum cinerariifolium]GFB17620.1 hypothetical protein [Tanacetum cinerariifolium]